jgi:hypothetical protein
MLASMDTPSLETKAERWKVRAQAKQKWLEQALAAPPKGRRQAAQRMAWIKRALKVVKRAQDRVKYQTRLVDAYAQHLNALEMTLMSEAEQKTTTKSGKSEHREQPGKS